MEGRPSTRRGGGFGGEQRGRGRGGHHRGRGKRDHHHRGRGRGGGSHAADFCPRDEGHNLEEDDDRTDVFPRRKLESNWDRYEESEKQEAEDDVPARRGEDFHVLLESAGDSFSQFRFSDEKDWTMDSFTATQMSPVVLDLPALAQTLQQVPLLQRLNLEAELLQVSTPVELPVVTLAPTRDKLKPATFSAPAPAVQEAPGDEEQLKPATFSAPASAVQEAPGDEEQLKPATFSAPAPASALQEAPGDNKELKPATFSAPAPAVQEAPGDEEELKPATFSAPAPASALQEAPGDEEELNRLLMLQKPAAGSPVEEAPHTVCDEVEEVKNEDAAAPKACGVRQEVSEEELEDWLDSIIS